MLEKGYECFRKVEKSEILKPLNILKCPCNSGLMIPCDDLLKPPTNFPKTPKCSKAFPIGPTKFQSLLKLFLRFLEPFL